MSEQRGREAKEADGWADGVKKKKKKMEEEKQRKRKRNMHRPPPRKLRRRLAARPGPRTGDTGELKPWSKPAVTCEPIAASPMVEEGSTTTMSDLAPDNIVEILLRLPSSASLAQVLSRSPRRWRDIASDSKFLEDFRKRHPSSSLIGLFASDDGHGYVAAPHFYRPCSGRGSDPDIIAVTRKGDFHLTHFDGEASLRLRDCRNGHLLLCLSDNSLRIYNPASRQHVCIPSRPHDGMTDKQCLADCLLEGRGTSSTVQQSGQRMAQAMKSFRVVSLQQHGQEIRAVVYDSNTRKWHSHPWVSPGKHAVKGLQKRGMMAMYAGGDIFWRCDESLVLVLETSTMEFSLRTLPPDLSFAVPSRYAIGEIEDDKGYLVCLTGLTAEEKKNPTLEVWALDTEMWKLDSSSNNKSWKLNSSEKWWKLEKKIHVSQLLGESTRVRQVCMVINGLALICMDERHTQFVVDLESMSLLGEFTFRGRGYPYQMSWPPVGLAAASVVSTPTLKETWTEEMLSTSEGSRGTKRRCSLNGVELLDEKRDGEHSKLNLNNRMEEPPTLSCSEPNNPKDGEPGGQRAKLKTNACPEDQHLPSPSRDVMPSMVQINLGENSPEASVYSARVGYHDANVPRSEARFPETETTGCTSSVKTLLDSMPNSKDKDGSHLIKSTQTPLVSADNLPAVEPSPPEEGSRRKMKRKKSVENNNSDCKVQNKESDEAAHPKSRVYLCSYVGCKRGNQPFQTKQALNRHMASHNGKPFKCEQCGKKFKREVHLTGHNERFHVSTTPVTCKLIGCSEVFHTKYEMNEHEQSKAHQKDGRFKCIFKGCTETFSQRSDFTRHYRHMHKQGPVKKKQKKNKHEQASREKYPVRIRVQQGVLLRGGKGRYERTARHPIEGQSHLPRSQKPLISS